MNLLVCVFIDTSSFSEKVEFMNQLILVDKNDNIVGYETKEKCHDNEGLLHRAFSIFVFDSQGRLLIQRRSRFKRLWPLFWSNTCCSHPLKDESYLAAGERRLPEETGIRAKPAMLYTFTYSARYLDKGSERELCAVMAAKSDEAPTPDPEEIDEWSYIPVTDLISKMQKEPDLYTPWFHMECKELFGSRLDELNKTLGLEITTQ